MPQRILLHDGQRDELHELDRVHCRQLRERAWQHDRESGVHRVRQRLLLDRQQRRFLHRVVDVRIGTR